MFRSVRRLFVLGLLGALGLAAWKRFVQGPHSSTPGAPVTYDAGSGRAPDAAAATNSTTSKSDSSDGEAASPASEPVPAPSVQGFTAVSQGAAKWVLPIDGGCPDGYPIKANANSGIFHVPGGRFYERTVPERCYALAEDAAADGFRAAKA